MSVPESLERWEVEHHLMMDLEPSRFQFLRAVGRLGYALYFRPYGVSPVDWSVFAADHLTQHKVQALRFDFWTYDGLAQPMRVALDFGRPLAFHRLSHGGEIPEHTFLTYPEPKLMQGTWPRFFMTAYQRASTMKPWPQGIPPTQRATPAEAGEVEVIHAELTEQQVSPYSERETSDMILDALKRIIKGRPELALDWLPQNAEDVLKLGSAYRYCQPCLEIADMSAAALDVLGNRKS